MRHSIAIDLELAVPAIRRQRTRNLLPHRGIGRIVPDVTLFAGGHSATQARLEPPGCAQALSEVMENDVTGFVAQDRAEAVAALEKLGRSIELPASHVRGTLCRGADGA